MKCRSLLFVFFSLFVVELFAQKPPIDTAAFKKWPDLGTPSISNDGRFVFYTIHNNEFNVDTLVLQSTDAKWKISIIDVKVHTFTEDSKKLIYVNKNDSLCIQDLTSLVIHFIPNVDYFFPLKNDVRSWLIYKVKGPENVLGALNLKTGKQYFYSAVVGYVLSNDGEILVLQRELNENGAKLEEVKWITLKDGSEKRIWTGLKARSFSFDKTNRKLAFLGMKLDCENCEQLLFYNSEFNAVAQALDFSSEPGCKDLEISEIQGFNKDGSNVFLFLTDKRNSRLNDEDVNLNIWSYTDFKLQPQQLRELDDLKRYLAVVDIRNRSIVRLQYSNESSELLNDDYVLVRHVEGEEREREWNSKSHGIYYLVSTKNGERKLLKDLKDSDVKISPEGRFITCYDSQTKNYLIYEISSGIMRHLTGNIKAFHISKYPRGIVGWSNNDAEIMLYDDFDIYLIDPLEKRAPINITNRLGYESNIVFSYVEDDRNKVIDLSKGVILNAFNVNNKKNGFYVAYKEGKKNPELLTMDDCYFNLSKSGFPTLERSNFTPVKALKSDVYILKRSTANEFGNFYSTRDFKAFISLSNLHPEKLYNWYTTELCTWKSLKGTSVQGILYKPENFDPTKKYPVIFHYYDIKSTGLNAYIKPDYLSNNCTINIPLFVSNGYLVVAADIKNETDVVGENVVSSIVSGANYFSKVPFVDSKKMGIIGYSHGGYETYQLLTQTNFFAAACGGGGVTDLVSHFGTLREKTLSNQEGATMKVGGPAFWENSDLYIKNSPVFNVGNVRTPLLMMHTTTDGAVDFTQAIELFTALRLLGKVVWLLEYTDGNHAIHGKSAVDYSKRMMQFFDYYLKEKPAPKWMLDGIPARLKGIETGLELDTTGRKPGPGLRNKI